MFEQLGEVQRNLREAIQKELPNLDRLREKVRTLPVMELGYRDCYALAPVATDGGENNLSLDPLNIEIIRIADSNGKVHFERFIHLSQEPTQIGDKLSEEEPLLKKFLQYLDISDWKALSYLYSVGNRTEAEEALGASDTRRLVKTLRDILEWAVLLDLAHANTLSRFLLIRDGLLRTRFIKKGVFGRLAEAFRKAYEERGTMIVGVAKRSKALNYLSLALALERTFGRKRPCFAEVPQELEKEAYTWAKTWMEGQSFGRLHLVKLTEDPGGPIFPVDIPEWLLPRRREVLECLVSTARSSFPIPGYPQPLILAHERANLSGYQMDLLGDLATLALVEEVPSDQKEDLLRHILLGRNLIKGGNHDR